MTPREALYYVCVALGPQPETKRDDNLTHEEARLRDAIKALQNFVTYHADADRELPDSVGEFVHIEPRRPSNGIPLVHPRKTVRPRGDGKDRLEAWKKELPPLSREDFIE